MKKENNPVRLFTRDFSIICTSMIFSRMVFMMQNSVIPLYLTDSLGAKKSVAGLIVAVASISSIMMRPVAGGLVDSGRGKAVYIAGAIVYLFGVVATGYVGMLPLLFAVRFIYGLGQSAQGTSGSAIAIKLIPDSRMKEGVGYFGLTGTLAQAVGPPIALFVILRIGYSNQFLSSGFLLVLALVGGLIISVPKRESADESLGERPPDADESSLSQNESFRFWHRIIEKTAVANALLCILFNISLCAASIFITIRANEIGVGNIGLFFTVQAISLTVSRIILNRYLKGKAERTFFFASLVAVALCLLCIAFASTIAHFIIIAIAYGVFQGNASVLFQTMIIMGAPPSRRGLANSTYFLTFDAATAIGAAVWGFVAELLGTRMVYVLASLLPIATLFLLLLKEKKTKILVG